VSSHPPNVCAGRLIRPGGRQANPVRVRLREPLSIQLTVEARARRMTTHGHGKRRRRGAHLTGARRHPFSIHKDGKWMVKIMADNVHEFRQKPLTPQKSRSILVVST
jgi:hypothetical protein